MADAKPVAVVVGVGAGLGAALVLRPSAIAETYWHVAHQHPSAWTQEVDVRPFKEKF